MNIKNKLVIIGLFLAVSFQNSMAQTISMSPLRGVNISSEISEEDLKYLSEELGANLVRMSFPTNTFTELEPPYEFKQKAFNDMEKTLDLCEKYNIKVIIDPHRFPGTKHMWTMLGNDPFWEDFKYHDEAIRIWKAIAKKCKKRGDVIAGYDLMNEPQIDHDFEAGTPKDLGLLYEKLTTAIRKIDKKHAIIWAAPRVVKDGEMLHYAYGAKYLPAPNDKNIWIETHIYNPQKFSHQYVTYQPESTVQYPGEIEGVYWDKAKIDESLKDLVEYSEKYKVHVFVGEFSSPRFIGEVGNVYLKDVVELCEKYGWSWAYHSYRESPYWEMDMSNTDQKDEKIYKSTPRLELFKKAFRGELAK